MSIQVQGGPQAGLYEELAALSGADHSLALSEIVLAPGALDQLCDLVRPAESVLIAQDDVDMFRSGVSIKPMVSAALRDAGYLVEVVRLSGEVHPDSQRVAQVRAGMRPGQAVICLGSGVLADITKHAVHEYETHHQQRLRLIVAQTANSVCAFTSGMVVLTIDGVKRTLPSRLPDVLLLDTQLLTDAPPEYNLGGIGDASVAAASFADYRLGHLLGLTGWQPLSWDLMAHARSRFLARDKILSGQGLTAMGATALDLAACGLAMTVAGESAPLSGLEHVTSHTLDMAAQYHQRPIGNHGSQCALATILSLIAWQRLLDLESLDALDPAAIDSGYWRSQVEAAFGPIDKEGLAWQECWKDFSQKIEQWRANAEAVRAFTANWPRHREDLRRFVTTPQEYVAALAATGHPLWWEDIPTRINESHARWAFTNARLMRKRTSVADVLGFAGLWTDGFINEVFDTYHAAIAPYT